MNPTTTILIVDDDSGSRRVAVSLLAAEQHRLLEAANGEEALRIAAQERPDIVFLDVMMPGMDGYEVCRRLRADPALCAIPILMLTTLDDRSSRLKGLEAGADDFLNKPVDSTELRTRVRTIARLNRFRLLHEEAEQRKQLEAQLLRFQRLELMGQFAGGIVHDFNNVLSPILAGAQMLRPGVAADDQQWLDFIDNAAQHGMALVQQLLLFARGGSGERELVAPRGLFAEVAAMLKSVLPHSVRLETEAPGEAPLIHGNRPQLQQVLMNLAVNARDALPGKGHIRLTAHVREVGVAEAAAVVPAVAPGTYVVLAVRDDGPGMSPEILAKIFEPFFTTKAPGKGTGLGLATVMRLVRAHGGFVQVESTPGAGASFLCHFPAVPADAATKAI